ncbi:MAG: hypothetical protein IMZ70_01335 [Candidatus Atribacteria bacterium]|nr:hypothetical protein [Candidatus Atribacteria bacterium]MBE3145005.1 hypothetical protein [Planctomycetota bacterium]
MKQLSRFQGWTLGAVVCMVMWCLIIGGTCALVGGCGDPMMQGVAIGVGGSQAVTEAADLAQENKTVLVAEILRLRQDLSVAATPEQQEALQFKLDAAEKKQEIADLTASITNTIQAGIQRDWGDKPLEGQEGANNLAYILGTLATLATGYAGKKTLDSNKQAAAIARVKIAAKPADEQKVYNAINGA